LPSSRRTLQNRQVSAAELLRRRGVAALLGSELVSRSGTAMSLVALPWFVLVTTGSPARTSLVMAAAAAGFTVCGIPGGWVANRLGARRYMLASNLVRAPLIGLIPFLHEVGALRFWMLPVIAFAVEAQSAAYEGAQAAILAELVGEDQTALAQATALFQAAQRATNLVGPGLAGALIAVVGASRILWIDAATYAVAFLLTLLIPFAVRAAPDSEDLEHLFAGVRFIKTDAFLRLFTAILTVWEGAFGAIVVLFPIIAFRRYHGDSYVAGGLLAAMGAGAIVGSVVAYRLVARFPPVRLGAAATLGQTLPVWVLAFHVPAFAAFAATAVSGFFQPIANAPTFSYVSLRIPVSLRPTVLTTFATITLSADPVGIALAGPLVVWVGLGRSVVIFAAVVTCASVVYTVAAPRTAGERARLRDAVFASGPAT
jgi:MFS family permease